MSRSSTEFPFLSASSMARTSAISESSPLHAVLRKAGRSSSGRSTAWWKSVWIRCQRSVSIFVFTRYLVSGFLKRICEFQKKQNLKTQRSKRTAKVAEKISLTCFLQRLRQPCLCCPPVAQDRRLGNTEKGCGFSNIEATEETAFDH